MEADQKRKFNGFDGFCNNAYFSSGNAFMQEDKAKLKADMCRFYLMGEEDCVVFPHWMEAYILQQVQQCMYGKGLG